MSKEELTLDQRQKVAKWLNDKGKSHDCPVCSHNNWTVGSHMITGLVFAGGSVNVGGTMYPQVFVACNNCAYVRSFMAVPILGESALKDSNQSEASGDG